MSEGFNTRRRDLRKQLDAIKTTEPAAPVKGPVFTKPSLVAEIEYRGWTGDGKLRHASVKGLRESADAAEVYEIED